MITWRARVYKLRDTALPPLTGPIRQVRNTPEPCGMPRTDAADLVRHMAGRYQMPDALRRADIRARIGLPQPP